MRMSMATKKGTELAEGAIALAVAGYVIVIKYIRNRHKLDKEAARSTVGAQLRKYAATLSGDSEFKAWATTTRNVAAHGLASDEMVTKEELLRLKALRKSS
jgi:hypothetical protein